MIVLVIGGSGSGKSEFAETICMELPAEEKCYIATMQAFDDESRARIAKHRKARSGKGFETIEQGTHLEAVCLPGGCTALLECMSNLVANAGCIIWPGLPHIWSLSPTIFFRMV